jgi:ATP-dependent DNA helicase RecQ
LQKAPDAPTIVYVTLQKTAETVAEFLKSHGIRAHAYHAGMQNNDRETIQNRFMADDISCIVATIAFGMGIDKKDIRRIIHYDLPKSLENYSQEIGRAGRDGNLSLCEVLANLDGVPVLENFIYGDTPDKDAIFQLVSIIRENEGTAWEFKISRLSQALNIRVLPLKTLLVYLSMEGIVRPRVTSFDEYAFNFLTAPETIIEKFTGERRQFVTAILAHCITRKIWTIVDIDAIGNAYPAERRRITAALEYFDEKGFIELRTRQSVEVYDILSQAFDPEAVAKNIHRIFANKESHGIFRIHEMVTFFQTRTCISRALAAYFGEQLETENCGHCSFCNDETVSLEVTDSAKPLCDHDFNALTGDFRKALKDPADVSCLARFLCGIYTPGFSTFKVKAIPNFGALTPYPYPEVRKWVSENLAAG